LMDELITISDTKKQLEEREKAIKDVLLQHMSDAGADKWANDLIEVTRNGAYERTSIDSTRLKKEQPDLFERFKKVTNVAESITYKVL